VTNLRESPCHEFCKDQHANVVDAPGYICWAHRVWVVDGKIHGRPGEMVEVESTPSE